MGYKPEITERTSWTPGWIVEDKDNHMLICVDHTGTVQGTCDTLIPPSQVKRWIVKVGEFKRIDICNQKSFINEWNQKMVGDDDDRYRF